MSLISQLEKYKTDIPKKAERLAKRMVEEGEKEAVTKLVTADYSGSLRSEIVSNINGLKGSVTMQGHDAGMIEFGAGTQYPDIHPLAQEFGAIRGEYGSGHGNLPRWGFADTEPGKTGYPVKDSPGEYWTMGTPANRVIYSTGKHLENIYVELAKEVFGK